MPKSLSVQYVAETKQFYSTGMYSICSFKYCVSGTYTFSKLQSHITNRIPAAQCPINDVDQSTPFET